MTTEQPTVRVGQIWEDCDKRSEGRQVQIIEVLDGMGEHHAEVEVIRDRQGGLATPGRQTRIRLDRFKPTASGYRLVEDVPGEGQ